uniref:ATPase V1 complex subunit H C-terminal domain-containing protein n=1 Tax=Palpitomonas bilix TaxID=652834 RepID=A0A7S3GG84_9EUKA|mmetsp:Transcript_47966/g.124541  ORF Transcript_47966/g.124541 Transcript_47966/m.124541 type:complete len:706 (+) Transcript_47966:227-2344(+)
MVRHRSPSGEREPLSMVRENEEQRLRRSSARRVSSPKRYDGGRDGGGALMMHSPSIPGSAIEMDAVEVYEGRFPLGFSSTEPVEWDVFRNSGLVSEADTRLLQRMQGAPLFVKIREYEEASGAYNAVFISIISRLRDEKLLRFVLGEVCSLLDIGSMESPWRRIAKNFLKMKGDKVMCPYRAFFSLLSRYDRHGDEVSHRGVVIIRLACHALCTLLAVDETSSINALEDVFKPEDSLEPLGLLSTPASSFHSTSTSAAGRKVGEGGTAGQAEDLLMIAFGDYDSPPSPLPHSSSTTRGGEKEKEVRASVEEVVSDPSVSNVKITLSALTDWCLQRMAEAEHKQGLGHRVVGDVLDIIRGILSSQNRRKSFFFEARRTAAAEVLNGGAGGNGGSERMVDTTSPHSHHYSSGGRNGGRVGGGMGGDRLHLFTSALRVSDTQTQYAALKCIWLASFDAKLVSYYMSSSLFLESVVSLLTVQRNARAKVIRVVLAVLKNLVCVEGGGGGGKASRKGVDQSGGEEVGISNGGGGGGGRNAAVRREIAQELLDLGVVKLMEASSVRRVIEQDEEAKVDAEAIRSAVERSFEFLSSFHHYSAEVMSGHLQWSPPHKSSQFWVENGMKLLEKDGMLFKKLVNIIEKGGSDGLSIAVACNDLGQFFGRFPAVRRKLNVPILRRVKRALATLMLDEDVEIKTQALYCFQRIIVSA